MPKHASLRLGRETWSRCLGLRAVSVQTTCEEPQRFGSWQDYSRQTCHANTRFSNFASIPRKFFSANEPKFWA
jgi:hypothetical protein